MSVHGTALFLGDQSLISMLHRPVTYWRLQWLQDFDYRLIAKLLPGLNDWFWLVVPWFYFITTAICGLTIYGICMYGIPGEPFFLSRLILSLLEFICNNYLSIIWKVKVSPNITLSDTLVLLASCKSFFHNQQICTRQKSQVLPWKIALDYYWFWGKL